MSMEQTITKSQKMVYDSEKSGAAANMIYVQTLWDYNTLNFLLDQGIPSEITE